MSEPIKMTVSVPEATEALVKFIREADLDTLARIFEDTFGPVKENTCFSDIGPEGGRTEEQKQYGWLEFEINTEDYPDYDEAEVRKHLELPPK